MIKRFRSYLRVNQAKMIVWGVFMIPYLLAIVYFSSTSPLWVRRGIEPLIVLVSKSSSLQGTSNKVGPAELTMGYILVTYLWACILVESFAILRHNGKKGIFQNQSIHPGAEPSSSRRVRKTIRRHDQGRSFGKSK
ncbi:MAG: hypothetical protein ABI758_00920 [Candidatus Woesebacteria bacterium]